MLLKDSFVPKLPKNSAPYYRLTINKGYFVNLTKSNLEVGI